MGFAGDGIYFEAGDRLWVNQYAPSTAKWSEAGVDITMTGDFPMGDTARLTLGLRESEPKAPPQAVAHSRRPQLEHRTRCVPAAEGRRPGIVHY